VTTTGDRTLTRNTFTGGSRVALYDSSPLPHQVAPEIKKTVVFDDLNSQKIKKILKIQNFIIHPPINTPPTVEAHFTPFELISTLLYTTLSNTMSNWTPDMQSWFDLLNTPPTTTTDEFIDSSLLHH
jgi:hypothetical protein